MKTVKPPSPRKTSIWMKLLLFSLVSFIMGAVAFLYVLKYFPVFSVYVSGKVDWGVLDGFVGVFSLSLLVGGFTFAVSEYIDTERAKHAAKHAEERDRAKFNLEIYQEIFEKYSTPEQEAARRWILFNISIKQPDEDIDTWFAQTKAKIMGTRGEPGDELPEGQKALVRVLNCFDYIGYTAMNYWSVEDDSNSNLDWLSLSVTKVWRRIGPYVTHLRKLRNSPDWHITAEYLGDLCIDWRVKQGLPPEFFTKE